jgi:DNA-binding response OmpR family regulator
MTGVLRRILVIEDDLETATQIATSLAACGYEVDQAVNGNDGLERGRTGEYCVVTIDRMLPDIDGISVIRSLREDGILFQVLEYLVRNQGQIVPRAMLLQHVWDLHHDPTTNIIDVYVGRIRRKVDDQQAYPLIHTVRGVGFRILAPA